MKNPLSKLLSDTAIYGLTHSLGRFLNFLLVPLYTGVFTVDEYGMVNVYYSVVGLAIVLLMYGMETAFFNFTRSHDGVKTFSTAMRSILVSTSLFVLLGILFHQQVANFLEYPDQAHFVVLFVFILAFDAISTLPLAWLRYEKRPLRFGAIRLINIGLNIGFNLFFLLGLPWLHGKGYSLSIYQPSFGIGYIFVANLIASTATLILVSPQLQMLKQGFDKVLWRKMFVYARPLIWVGLAGIVNETMDRIILKKLLDGGIADYQIGVYSAFYKLSIVITLAVQSFRYAAEPFFFDQSKNEDAPQTYARVMHVFVIVLCGIFLATSVFAEPIGRLFIQRAEYFDHPQWRLLVPILLMANLFLGITFNLNIWYKLNDKTRLGMYISIGGAIMTLLLNFLLIPFIGILGSALTTLVVYVAMAIASYLMGQKHYAVPYRLSHIFFYLFLSVGLYLLFEMIRIQTQYVFLPGLASIMVFSMAVFLMERPLKNG